MKETNASSSDGEAHEIYSWEDVTKWALNAMPRTVPQRNGKLVIADFDNTLFFTDKCNALASKELFGKAMSLKEIRALPRADKSRVYALSFSKYAHLCIPNAKLIRALRAENTARIIILTAKSRESEPTVLRLLRKYNVRYDRLILRPKRELSKSDEGWKLEKIRSLSKGFETVELYEDKKDNIAYILNGIRRHGVSAFLVRPGSITRSDGY